MHSLTLAHPRTQSTWALWIVCLSQSLGTVANLLPFFLVAMEAFNGSLISYHQMPVYYRWLYWVSPFQHYVRAMLGALLHGQPVECADFEVVSFRPPPDSTCVLSPFVALSEPALT